MTTASATGDGLGPDQEPGQALARGLTVQRGGEPTDEEVAAIVAAVQVAWPRAAEPPHPARAPRWRFSGRWWSKPVPLRRTRPW